MCAPMERWQRRRKEEEEEEGGQEGSRSGEGGSSHRGTLDSKEEEEKERKDDDRLSEALPSDDSPPPARNSSSDTFLSYSEFCSINGSMNDRHPGGTVGTQELSKASRDKMEAIRERIRRSREEYQTEEESRKALRLTFLAFSQSAASSGPSQ